ncbi:MAG: septum formation protein Maf [Alphaproteobacteria bacterium]|nr:septum formation protein Maf [Alphaproteobacteria bacterium]
MDSKDFILASGSPQRRQLLAQIGFIPKKIQPADIDEHVLANENPLPYIRRIARAKAIAVKELYPKENVLSADTIIVVGQKIIQKSPDDAAQTAVMRLLSGRTHRVITSVCLADKTGHISQKTVTTKIVMKHLTETEISEYIKSGEWHGVAGYKIEGMLAGFVKKIIGSYSSVVGLPLYETKNMLNGIGVY